MLSNAQYAEVYGIPVEVEEGPHKRDIEDTLAFTIELPDGSDMWYAKPVPLAEQVATMEKMSETVERAANLAKYIRQGYAFEQPNGEKEEEEEDETKTD